MSRRKLLKALIACTMLFFSFISNAQDRVITGRVTDSKDGSAVAGVSVSAKGGSSGTQTDANGSYRITVGPSVTTLVFTSIGFTTQEINIEGKSSVDVSFVVNNASLGEVVVIAYGTRKRGDLTGAVSSVSAKDFQKGNIASSEQLLQGKVAGLQVTSGGGSAGGGSRIRIRGAASLNSSNDPLIVIDGVPVEGNGIAGSANLLNTINPDDIESISVLKDASAAALYGSRASNGVIIITTKKGTRGKLRFNFNTQLSSFNIGQKVDVLTGDEVRKIITEDALKTGDNTYKNLLGTANTDWQDEIYQMAVSNNNNLSVSGSIKNMPIRASIGFLTQEGILKTDKFDRYSAALNFSPKFFDEHLTFNISAKGSQTKNRFADGGAIGSAVAFDPTKPVYGGSKYGGYYEWLQANDSAIALATRNPVALLKLRDNRSKVYRLIGNVQMDYKLHFLPDLHLQANIGVDRIWGKGNDNIDSALATNYMTGGRRAFYKQDKANYLFDVSLFYAKELKSINSKFDVLLTHSYQDFITNVFNYPAFSYRAIADPANPQRKDTIANTTPPFATDKPQYRLESYLGRLNYTLADKYLLTASIRRDASSKFASDNRVGYFPAFALAWKVKEEFLRNSRVVSELKLRLGWGVTGQQDGIAYYSYLPRYSASVNTAAQYQFGDTYFTFLRPAAYDASIKWETTTTANIAVDFGFFGNRITGSVDFYQKKTKDLLSVIPVAPGSNFDIALLTNVGNMENRGVEVVLNTTPVRGPKVTWDLGFNVTYNETEITRLLKQPDPNFKGIDVSGISGGTGNNIGKFAVGYAPYTFFVYKQIYDQSGKPIEGLYEDLNRDGIITNEDRYLYKKPAPDIMLGLNTAVTVGKWNLGLAGHGLFGNYLYNNFNSNNGVLRAIKNPINFIGNASSDYYESTQFNNNQYFSDYYIENASFFRLDNINLSYNAGGVLGGTSNLRVSANVQNAFIISKYKGLDPENASDSGVDNNIYPRPRIFTIGLNLDF